MSYAEPLLLFVPKSKSSR